MNKTCDTCNKELPITSFKKHKNYITLQGEVKECWYNTCKTCRSIKKVGYSLKLIEQERVELLNKGLRKCSICNKIKKIEDYTKDIQQPQGYKVFCKSCKPEYKKNQSKDWRIRNRYKISLMDYNEMIKIQNNECLICGKKDELVIDHCHASGKVRGLLCHSCNLGLGYFKDNINTILNAADYLNEHSTTI